MPREKRSESRVGEEPFLVSHAVDFGLDAWVEAFVAVAGGFGGFALAGGADAPATEEAVGGGREGRWGDGGAACF